MKPSDQRDKTSNTISSQPEDTKSQKKQKQSNETAALLLYLLSLTMPLSIVVVFFAMGVPRAAKDGENLVEVEARSRAAVEAVLDRGKELNLIVSHGR